MHGRAGRKTLSNVTFSLLPENLRSYALEDPVEVRYFQSLFEMCHTQVYGKASGLSVSQLAKKVCQLASKAKCSVRLYVLTNMLGYQLAWPEEDFKPSALADGRAYWRVATYCAVCVERYGSVTEGSLSTLLKSDVTAYSPYAHMEESEFTVATKLIDYRLRNDGAPYDAVLTAVENEVWPEWLAVEPRYYQRFTAQPVGGLFAAREAHGRMKKHKHIAIGYFRAREAVLPHVLKKVLNHYGYDASDFERKPTPVTDVLLFWTRLGLAIQHYECLKFLAGHVSMYSPPRPVPTASARPKKLLPIDLLLPDRSDES